MPTDHTTVRLNENDKQKLQALARQFGYTRKASDVDAADLSGFVKAIANGELIVTRNEEYVMATNNFERKGEWSGYSVHESATGFVVDYKSRIQGERDGLRILVPFSPTFYQGMDLEGQWNDHTSNGEAVATIGREHAKILRNGEIVR